MTIAPGRRALVTGGASGLGLAIARMLEAAGAEVAVADVAEPALARAAEERLVALRLDVTDPADVARGVAEVEQRLGGLDTLVISAGIIHVKPLEQVTFAEWEATLAVNLTGAFLVTQAAAPALRASGRGRIVAISSDAGRRGYPWIQAYVASKFGLIGLMESVAVELADAAVTVNTICPTSCPTTGMGRHLTAWKAEQSGQSEEAVLAQTRRSFPLGRYVDEQEVAAAAGYFISDEAATLTGVKLDIDAGQSLGFIPAADTA